MIENSLNVTISDLPTPVHSRLVVLVIKSSRRHIFIIVFDLSSSLFLSFSLVPPLKILRIRNLLVGEVIAKVVFLDDDIVLRVIVRDGVGEITL